MMLRQTFPGRSCLVAAVLLATCGAASAQRAALVQNVDEPARTPYQQQLNCTGGSSNVCRFTYDAVPAGKRREIRLVSCSAQSRPASQAMQFQSAQLFSTHTNLQIYLPTPVQNGPIYNGLVYGQTSMFFEAGDVPFIQMLGVPLIGGATCTVVGHDIAI